MKQGVDKTLIALIFAIGAISISTIFAANKSLALNQIVFWIFGTSLLFLASQLHNRTWQTIAIPFYLASLVMLALVFVIGEPVRGSVRWIDLGIFRFQPSEIAKISTILLLATFFIKRSAEKISNFALSLLIVAPIFLLVLFEPDIGSAMSIVAIWLAISFAAGIKREHLVSLFLLFLLLTVISYEILAPYQRERIETFINPSRDPLGAGYNIIQSKISIGAGELFGRGLGQGSQSQLNFLPEAESDFIFASIAEQLGFVGAGILIILFVIFLIKVSNLAKSKYRFGQLVAMGALGLFVYQFCTNVGMNMGLIPITGITLPLVSYGGSSLASNLILLGILFSVRSRTSSALE